MVTQQDTTKDFKNSIQLKMLWSKVVLENELRCLVIAIWKCSRSQYYNSVSLSNSQQSSRQEWRQNNQNVFMETKILYDNLDKSSPEVAGHL